MISGEVGGNASNERLREHVARIEGLLEQRAEINDDIKDQKVLAKSEGYDPRMIMQVIKVRAMQKEVYQEQKSLLETYLAAFGIED